MNQKCRPQKACSAWQCKNLVQSHLVSSDNCNGQRVHQKHLTIITVQTISQFSASETCEKHLHHVLCLLMTAVQCSKIIQWLEKFASQMSESPSRSVATMRTCCQMRADGTKQALLMPQLLTKVTVSTAVVQCLSINTTHRAFKYDMS